MSKGIGVRDTACVQSAPENHAICDDGGSGKETTTFESSAVIAKHVVEHIFTRKIARAGFPAFRRWGT